MHTVATSSMFGAPRVLVAEDDPATRDYLTSLLTGQGMSVRTADDGRNAVAQALEGGLDLILLNLMMPGMDGLDGCRLIKSTAGDAYLPVVLLTAVPDNDSRIAGLRIGADDYLCKPFDERELLARIHNLLRLKRMHDQISAAKERLAALATRDELTGLYNYRFLQTRLAEEWKRAERYREPLACLMVDVDHFKQVNDRHGHGGGDDALRELSVRLQKSVREVDVVARYGGEEFLLVLPSTTVSGGMAVAERVLRAVGEAPFELAGNRERITVSLGLAVYPGRDIKSKDQLVRAADGALYRAKRDGRDRICVHQPADVVQQAEALRP